MTGRGARGSEVAESRAQAAALLVELRALPADSPRREAVRERLVRMHMALVEYLARRFAGRSEPLADLVQVGAIGLLKSIDRFDPERGVEFSSYATPTIIGEIKRHFRDTGWLIHVPRRAQEMQGTLAAARAELSQRLRRAPTVAELAEHIGRSQEEVLEALDVARGYSATPIDALTEAGDAADHPLLAELDQHMERVEQRALLRPLLRHLPEREREILLLRFVAGKSQTEIAGIIGVSQMQVSRLIARSLATLREQLDTGAGTGAGPEAPPV